MEQMKIKMRQSGTVGAQALFHMLQWVLLHSMDILLFVASLHANHSVVKTRAVVHRASKVRE